MIPPFRNLIVAVMLFVAAAISAYMLKYDYTLQLTPNYHSYVLVGFAALDMILALQLILTGLLRVWDRIVLRFAGVWAIIVMLAIIADVLFSLQLPQGYPQITQVEAFEYLFLGINGNSVPLGTPALFALYSAISIVSLLPSNRFWFNWASLPTWRTVLVALFIGLIVLGLRPMFLSLNTTQTPSKSNATSSTEAIVPPTEHFALPFEASNRTVFLTLVAERSSSIPYNYNDTQYGHMEIFMPTNWTLDLTFVNQEGITHNAVLIKPDVAIPTFNLVSDGVILAEIPRNALGGSFLVSGESGSAVVEDLPSGTYWIACAMSFPTPHAESGMWIVLQVSNNVTTPYYVTNT